MARAKRTDRTDARRRNRAAQAAVATEEPGSEPVPATDRKSSAKAAPASAAAAAPRPSIRAAFRGASRPLDLRGDLRAFREVFTSWGFLVAIGLTAALGVWFVVAYSDAMAALPAAPTTEQLSAVVGANSVPYFVATMALQPPPALGAFLIGFAAKRASWLGGLVYGVFVTAMAAVIVQTPAGRLLAGTTGSSEAVILGHLAWSPLGAALFASAAAWYRRFLDLSNPNRAAQRQRQTPKSGRGNMRPVRR